MEVLGFYGTSHLPKLLLDLHIAKNSQIWNILVMYSQKLVICLCALIGYIGSTTGKNVLHSSVTTMSVLNIMKLKTICLY
jgi:hypothetical protein